MEANSEAVERWLPVLGFEGLYEVSSTGRVRRIGKAARNGKGRGGGATIGRIRTGQVTPFGYVQVLLWRNGTPHGKQVHVLVAEVFIGPQPVGHEVNHKDGNKQNNSDTNLEWVTRSQNMAHAYRSGLRVATVPFGEKHHGAKLTDATVAEIRQNFRRGYGPRFARKYGVDHATIYRIVKNKSRLGATR